MTIATPTLGFGEALNAATSKIFKMKGRARRSEFWWTQLLVYILSIFLTPIGGFIFSLLTIALKVRRLHDVGRSGWWLAISIILDIALFIATSCIIISCIVSYSDTDYLDNFLSSILKYFLFFLAIAIYKLVLFIFYCMDSDPDTNSYGPSPKYIEEVE